jgi:hypothetical protein
MKKLRFAHVAVVVALAAGVFGFPSASANHILATYGSRGYVWAATRVDGFALLVTSESCNQSELTAYDNVRTSTNNASGTFGTRWPSGIRMSRQPTGACTGAVNDGTDIKLDYLTATEWSATHTTNAGGENHSAQAPSSWCNMVGANFPCGTHWSTVHINNPKWVNTTAQGRRRLIMHETGHSNGLAHHCTSNSIMNDGSAGCNGGAWLNVDGYLATDRMGIVNIYPNWRYR